MIKETAGNLFETKAEALINAVNCVGVMGKGIALQFKQKFPADYFNAYKIACQNGELAIGSVQVYELFHPLTQAVLTKVSILKNVALRLSDFSRGFQPTEM
jgi:O-acetyl-ADP-ribose deacetylase (regulator of RNase III)